MLRKLLRSILFSTVAFTSLSGHALLFQAPSADSEAFQKYALTRNQQTYTQWVFKMSTEPAPEAHSQVLDFSQRALNEKSIQQRALEWDRLRNSISLNRLDREILTLLAAKLNLAQELCRYILLEPELVALLETPNNAANCQRQAIPLPKRLSAQLDTNDVLVIDGVAFTKNQIPSALVPGVYQWRIASDRSEDRIFTGTAEEFTKQKFLQQHWIHGNCANYQFQIKDLSLQLQSLLYFDETCVNPGIPKEKTIADWAREHKVLVWGVGLLAAAVAASQVKDKTLVITKP